MRSGAAFSRLIGSFGSSISPPGWRWPTGASGSNCLSGFVDGGGADGFGEPTVCPTAAEVSIRASNAIVVISFRMMDLPSWGHLTTYGSGETRAQGAQTSRFLQMFQGHGLRSAP